MGTFYFLLIQKYRKCPALDYCCFSHTWHIDTLTGPGVYIRRLQPLLWDPGGLGGGLQPQVGDLEHPGGGHELQEVGMEEGPNCWRKVWAGLPINWLNP